MQFCNKSKRERRREQVRVKLSMAEVNRFFNTKYHINSPNESLNKNVIHPFVF